MAINSLFHPYCFSCIACGEPFPIGGDIFYNDEDLYCKCCNQATSLKTKTTVGEEVDDCRLVCSGCDDKITGEALLTLGKPWHLSCFRCHQCNCILNENFFIGRDGVPLCEIDYHIHCGITCALCMGNLLGKGLKAGDRFYHAACARCCKCCDVFSEGEAMFVEGSDIWHAICDEESEEDEEDIMEEEKSAMTVNNITLVVNKADEYNMNDVLNETEDYDENAITGVTYL